MQKSGCNGNGREIDLIWHKYSLGDLSIPDLCTITYFLSRLYALFDAMKTMGRFSSKHKRKALTDF